MKNARFWRPSIVMCVQIMEQIDQHTWDNQRIGTDEIASGRQFSDDEVK
jgi:hypothetical protein